MEKIRVYTKARGVRVLKEGITLTQYQERYPDAIMVGNAARYGKED